MRGIVVLSVALLVVLAVSSWVTADSFDAARFWQDASAVAHRLMAGMSSPDKATAQDYDAEIAQALSPGFLLHVEDGAAI